MKKMFRLSPLMALATAGLLFGCQPDELAPVADADLKDSQSAGLQVCDVINFENAATFPRDANGYITGVISQNGVAVNVAAYARAQGAPEEGWGLDNRANIFNTTTVLDSDPDGDLKTPNWNNTTPSLGNVLIVQELEAPHNVASDPNDNAHGAKIELNFAGLGGVTIKSMHVLDIENHWELDSRVNFYNAAGTQINPTAIMIDPTGNNGVNLVTFNAMSGVVRMEIILDGAWNEWTNAGSGGIDNIEFCREIPDVPEIPCGTCEGKVSKMTFKYNGPDDATLTANFKVGSGNIPINVATDLDAGETFTLDGILNTDRRNGFAGTLGTDVTLFLAVGTQVTATRIHTSCSQPIFQSYGAGKYTTLTAFSKHGGRICDFAPGEPL